MYVCLSGNSNYKMLIEYFKFNIFKKNLHSYVVSMMHFNFLSNSITFLYPDILKMLLCQNVWYSLTIRPNTHKIETFVSFMYGDKILLSTIKCVK